MTTDVRRIITMLEDYARSKPVPAPYVYGLVNRIKRGEYEQFEPWEVDDVAAD